MFVGERTELGNVKYSVVVQTGNEFRCGTNANVFITIYGTNGDSGRRALTQARRNLFERNQKDNFELEAVDLGKSRRYYWSQVSCRNYEFHTETLQDHNVDIQGRLHYINVWANTPEKF